MRQKSLKHFLATLFLGTSMAIIPLHSQEGESQNIRTGFIMEMKAEGYQISDYNELRISSQHFSPQTGIIYTYFQQVYEGKDIVGAITCLATKGSSRFLSSNRFIKDVAENMVHFKSRISPYEAVESAAGHLGLPVLKTKQKIVQISDSTYSLDDPLLSKTRILIGTVLIRTAKNQIMECWNFTLESPYSQDIWEVSVDAGTGEIHRSVNYTRHCQFGKNEEQAFHKPDTQKVSRPVKLTESNNKSLVDGATYLVYPFPLESPLFGDQALAASPADTVASPFGWHDTDALNGPEFTITRGNNVHAFQDADSDNQSSNDEPEGGDVLSFIFEHDREGTIAENLEADVTNLFYWNNLMHDWAYKFGFDEAAGNFQQNNYNKGGDDNDYVLAQSVKGGDTNQATFSTLPDGSRVTMRMFPFRSGQNSLSVLSPAAIEGDFAVGTADFGPDIEEGIIGLIVLVDDGDSISTDACEPIINEQDVNGNIALVDRGTCFFIEKVQSAEAAGAIACIICNNNEGEGPVNMSAPDNSGKVDIPVVSLSKENCELIKSIQGSAITILINPIEILSSSFDNGVVVHEYAHGITNRLTGGRLTTGCLNNDEEAGEGWSDFFGLVLTHQDGNLSTDSRAIAPYLLGEGGVRRYPYSTDLSVNPQTMSHIRRTQFKHPLGEIWTAALWEMYWLFIERDGFDPTWSNISSGNYQAVQLVFDGLKLQPCNPGLLEARDAIIAADSLIYNGANKCLIWKAFAKRGMGFDAQGGSRFDRGDNVDGFSLPPECIQSLKIDKSTDPSVDAGAAYRVQIKVRNDNTEEAEMTVVTDEIPNGTQIIGSSASHLFTTENNLLRFGIGTLQTGEEIEINYELSSENFSHSDFNVYDNFEGALGFEKVTTASALEGWNLNTSDSKGGVFSIRVKGDSLQGESILVMKNPVLVTGLQPTLKFWHRYNTQTGIDGGVVEISSNGGVSWQQIPAEWFLSGGYSDAISFNYLYTNVLSAFTGLQDWNECQIDLSDYRGENILIRFRYIEQKFQEDKIKDGWLIDNFEIYDRQSLVARACVEARRIEMTCDSSLTLISSSARVVATEDLVEGKKEVLVYPSPSAGSTSLYFQGDSSEEIVIRIFNEEGRELTTIRQNGIPGYNQVPLDLKPYQSGVYFVELRLGDQRSIHKVIRL